MFFYVDKALAMIMVIYVLIIHYLKFIVSGAETEQGVAQAIIRSVIDFRRDPWPKVSESAKDLVKRMLDPDPKHRLTAQGVLGNISHFIMFGS